MSDSCVEAAVGCSLPGDATAEVIQHLLEVLPQHAALLGPTGEILFVNRAWRNFAAANGALNDADVETGANYLEVCRRAARQGESEAARVYEQLSELLGRGSGGFKHDYACHGPGVERWFAMEALALRFGGCNHALVFHHNQTLRHRVSAQLCTSGPQAQYGELVCVCAACKRVRRPDGSWSDLELSQMDLSGRDLSHGICLSCTEQLYPDLLDEVA